MCRHRLIDDDLLVENRSASIPSKDRRGAIFFTPEQSPNMSFSACLAENPGSFPALLHASLKSCRYGFIDSISAIFSAPLADSKYPQIQNH